MIVRGCVEKVSPFVTIALLCIGYGLQRIYCPVGMTGGVWATLLSGNTNAVLLARVLYGVALLASVLAWRAKSARNLLHQKKAALTSFAGAIGIFFVLAATFASERFLVGLLVCSFLLGVAAAVPTLGWFEGLLAICRGWGRGACIGALAVSALFSTVLAPLVQHVVLHGAAPFLFLATLVVVSGTCFMAFARLTDRVGLREEDASSRGERPYQPSLRLRLVVGACGFNRIMAYGLVCLGIAGTPGAPITWGVFAAGIFVNVLIIGIFWGTRFSNRDRFGLTLRWVIVVSCMTWAAVPVFVEPLSAVCGFLCTTVYLLVFSCVILLNVEVCREYGFSMVSVTATHYGMLYAGGAVATVVLMVLGIALEGAALANTVCAFASCVLLLTVPLLPSFTSGATDMVRTRATEAEGFDERVDANREALATRARLTDREAEVLDLLVRGLTRDEIAMQLGLSSHTIKNHTSSLYGKLGVHSARELSALVIGLDEKDT